MTVAVDRTRGLKGSARRAELDRLNAELEKVREISPDDRAALLTYVEANRDCTLREATKEVGIRRRDVRALLKADKEFEDDYRTARGFGAKQIFEAGRLLGVEGVEEYVVSAGKIVTYPEGHPRAGELVTQRKYSDRVWSTLFNALTPEGKAAAAGRFGLEIAGAGVQVQVQAGVPLSEVFEFMRQHVGAAALPPGDEIVGEVVAETDEPAA